MNRSGFLRNLSVFLAAGLIGLGSAQETEEVDLTTRPAADEGPTEVAIQVLWLDLDGINGADQSYAANIAFSAMWKDERLRDDGGEPRKIPLQEIWNPGLQMLNQQRVQQTFPEVARVSPDGTVEYVQRVWGSFSQPLVLYEFPFDRQTLDFDLVATGTDTEDIVFVDQEEISQIADSFSISDWEVVEFQAAPMQVTLVEGSADFQIFRMSLIVERNSGYHVLNFVLPLVLIICMSWIVFWIPPSNVGPRVSVSVTSMLTLVAYRFAVGAGLPKISYLTRMDWFILGSSLLIFVSLMQVVVTSWMAENDRLDSSRKINRFMRFASPALLVVILVFSMVL